MQTSVATAVLCKSGCILRDGSVVTWGSARNGGDSSSVQEQPKNVLHIQSSYSTFAAILRDGSVVTWGSASKGGDSSAAQERRRKVQQMLSSHCLCYRHPGRSVVRRVER